MMKEKLKWIWITTLIILVVSLILAFNLKSHYNHVHDKQKSKTNVQINNKNVKLYRDISYGKGIPNSKLDIITPADMLSLIHISEPTRQAEISYAVFCLKKKKK